MKDVQSQKDTRNIALKKVGINELKWPIKVMDKAEREQSTVATMDLSVYLPHDQRGTHMSRFVEVVKEAPNLSPKGLEEMLKHLVERLEAKKGHCRITFPYFITKPSPVTGIMAPYDVKCCFDAEYSVEDGFKFVLEVETPVTTLCPCSKEISEFGAHNQRALVNIKVEMDKLVWIEDLVKIAEESSSSPVFTLLKRQDEKWVTEQAYLNPRFVEDVARETASKLEEFDGITWYSTYVESIESIHNHSAFAYTEKGCTL
ncbi:MAG: GTP cyclohydrolase FolE2 [Clostridium sp.]